MLKNLSLAICVSAVFLSCHKTGKQNGTNGINKSPEITSIEVLRYGGMLGYNSTISITKDSITQKYSTVENNRKPTRFAFANTNQDWNTLTLALNLNDFKAVKDGSTNQSFDGLDEKIIIKTDKYSDSLINGEKDAQNYSKIKKFTERLHKNIADKFNNGN